MRKIRIIILHESSLVRKEISRVIKVNFPLIEVVGSYNINSEDLLKSLQKKSDLYLISSKINLENNSFFINKVQTEGDFILLINKTEDAIIGFKYNAIDVVDSPFTLEKLLFSINKYYWKFFTKRITSSV
jgi:two-component SAPR family response regulator